MLKLLERLSDRFIPARNAPLPELYWGPEVVPDGFTLVYQDDESRQTLFFPAGAPVTSLEMLAGELTASSTPIQVGHWLEVPDGQIAVRQDSRLRAMEVTGPGQVISQSEFCESVLMPNTRDVTDILFTR